MKGGRLIHGAVRGAVGAMAMTGMRTLTVDLGLIRRPPPQAMLREKAGRLLRRAAPRGRRRATEELLHWTYGAGGGIAFSALPEHVRRTRWAGPLYGLGLWLSFELVLAPLLGLAHARRADARARAALAADHALYGFVLSDPQRGSRG